MSSPSEPNWQITFSEKVLTPPPAEVAKKFVLKTEKGHITFEEKGGFFASIGRWFRSAFLGANYDDASNLPKVQELIESAVETVSSMDEEKGAKFANACELYNRMLDVYKTTHPKPKDQLPENVKKLEYNHVFEKIPVKEGDKPLNIFIKCALEAMPQAGQADLLSRSIPYFSKTTERQRISEEFSKIRARLAQLKKACPTELTILEIENALDSGDLSKLGIKGGDIDGRINGLQDKLAEEEKKVVASMATEVQAVQEKITQCKVPKDFPPVPTHEIDKAREILGGLQEPFEAIGEKVEAMKTCLAAQTSAMERWNKRCARYESLGELHIEVKGFSKGHLDENLTLKTTQLKEKVEQLIVKTKNPDLSKEAVEGLFDEVLQLKTDFTELKKAYERYGDEVNRLSGLVEGLRDEIGKLSVADKIPQPSTTGIVTAERTLEELKKSSKGIEEKVKTIEGALDAQRQNLRLFATRSLAYTTVQDGIAQIKSLREWQAPLGKTLLERLAQLEESAKKFSDKLCEKDLPDREVSDVWEKVIKLKHELENHLKVCRLYQHIGDEIRKLRGHKESVDKYVAEKMIKSLQEALQKIDAEGLGAYEEASKILSTNSASGHAAEVGRLMERLEVLQGGLISDIEKKYKEQFSHLEKYRTCLLALASDGTIRLTLKLLERLKAPLEVPADLKQNFSKFMDSVDEKDLIVRNCQYFSALFGDFVDRAVWEQSLLMALEGKEQFDPKSKDALAFLKEGKNVAFTNASEQLETIIQANMALEKSLKAKNADTTYLGALAELKKAQDANDSLRLLLGADQSGKIGGMKTLSSGCAVLCQIKGGNLSKYKSVEDAMKAFKKQNAENEKALITQDVWDQWHTDHKKQATKTVDQFLQLDGKGRREYIASIIQS